jgi:inorganic pyrophosphatase
MNDHGAYDGKILCVPEADPRQASINSIRQIGATRLEDVAEFFRTYRNFDGGVVTIKGWRDAHAVQPLLDSCIAAKLNHAFQGCAGSLHLDGGCLR